MDAVIRGDGPGTQPSLPRRRPGAQRPPLPLVIIPKMRLHMASGILLVVSENGRPPLPLDAEAGSWSEVGPIVLVMKAAVPCGKKNP